MSRLWRAVETWHAVVYYADERPEEYTALGLRGGWMGYFATRAAALGAVGPELVTACFYNFAPAMVARALPDAWTYTTPEQAVAARLRVVDRALHRLLGEASECGDVAAAAELAGRAARAAPMAGRPLFAAHRGLPEPEQAHLRLFWATTALREFRGDGHNTALLHAGIDGCEAHVLMAAQGLVPDDQRRYRGWSDGDWAAAVERLQRRGWLTEDIRLTDQGRQGREAVEQATEALAGAAWEGLDRAEVRRLELLLTPVATAVAEAGGLPFPNGMGLPRPG